MYQCGRWYGFSRAHSTVLAFYLPLAAYPWELLLWKVWSSCFLNSLEDPIPCVAFTVSVTVMFEIPIFQVAPWLLERVGAGPLQLVAGLSYIVRVLGYTLIPKSPLYLVLLVEPLHGVTYACSQTSSVDFVAQLVPKGSEASG
jgi:hypothetical protein